MKRPRRPAWARSLKRSFAALGRQALKTGQAALIQALATPAKPERIVPRRPAAQRAAAKRTATSPRAAAVVGSWRPGVALGPGGARCWRLYRPPGLGAGERLPLLVLLHGCTQDADAFARKLHDTAEIDCTVMAVDEELTL